MTGGMIKFIEGLGNILAKISVVSGVAMAALVVLGVLMRYLFGAPLGFSDELVGLLFVLIAFAILPANELQGRNIRVTLVVDRLPPRVRAQCRLASQFLALLFALVFGYLSFRFAMVSAKFDARMDSLDFSLVPWIMIIPVTLLVTGGVALAHILRPGIGGGEDNG